MSFELLVAPPGAGKTTLLLKRAREATEEGKRVWWVGLPSQRNYLYRRATEAGALLGLEFLSSQQVYYRLLAHALKLKPLVVGTGRLAMVGEALMTVRGELPSPGEARLFARAIAEAKRYGVAASEVPAHDEETARLRDIYTSFETIKGDAWDYDDFRLEALALAEGMERRGEAEVVIVDGLRDIGPLELRLYRALGRHAKVWLSLPAPPPGETPTRTLPAVARTTLLRLRPANPVAEARWVLRALKRDLASGLDPLELAVIVPESAVRAFSALADEYGVPLMDETPKALADSLPGRLLLDLLELPDYPTASRLLAIPELAPLANAALNAGVAGFETVGALAGSLGLDGLWHKWRALLEVEGDELGWARTLLETGLPAVRRDLLERDELGYGRFKELALLRAQEAVRVAKGPHFRAWWAALLHETFLFDRPRGGVALLTMNLASGRRFRRAYLLGAAEGAYRVGEAEDYFVPEEDRRALAHSFAELGLARRFLGRDQALKAELLTRAEVLVVSCPEADQGGPLAPDAVLIGELAEPLPKVPAGSRLELAERAELYRAPLEQLALGGATVEKLRRYRECPFRFWAEETLKQGDDKPWWLELLDELRAYSRLNPVRLEELKDRFPEAAEWLTNHAEQLARLTFGVSLPEGGEGPKVYLDAAGRSGAEVTLFRFVGPDTAGDSEAAAAIIERRWNEYWAAAHMLTRYQGRVTRVFVTVWPLLGEPIAAFENGIDRVWRRISTRQRKAEAAHRRFQAGDISPNPGFHCRTCRVFDVCREGTR